MAPNFDPDSRESINLFGQKHVVQPHPQASHWSYSQYAGRAVVHQVRNQKGEYLALKVFKKKYRDPHLIDSTQVLSHIENFEGLRAAHRRIILPDDPAALKHRNLQYAMLMSWVHGTTWFDILGQAREEEEYRLPRPAAIRLCDRFLEVMEGLEMAGVAHTDISPGNVTVEIEANDVQLLDLEDMYMPGTPTPSELNIGSDGYRHRSGDEGETCWRADGDRYAAAVLAAEMLVLTNPKLVRKAKDEGFYPDHHGTSEGMSRFKEAQVWLEEIAPGFAPVFERSWFAGSLEECPRISELRTPIKDLASDITHEDIPVIEDERITNTPPPPVQGNLVEWVRWDADAFPSSGSTARKPPPPPPRRSTPKTPSRPSVVSWSHGQVDEEPPVDGADDPGKPLLVGAAKQLFIMAAITLFVLVLILIIAANA